jgi:tetratricopeptide (TPR) repeat protein
MKYIPIIIFLLLCSILYSDNYLLEFIDGTIEYSDGSGWQELFIGEYIPADTEIKIYDDTYAEITSGNIKITLSMEGVYSVEDLFKSSESVSSWNFSSIIGEKVSKLTGFADEDLGDAQMGVRGNLLYVSEVEWMDDEEQSLNDAKEKIAEMDYMTALEILLDAVPYSVGSVLHEMNFFIGFLYNKLNNQSLALKHLNSVPNNKYAVYFPELVLLKSTLLIESLNFEKALELLDIYKENYPDGSKIQSVYFLTAICMSEQGKTDLCRTNLEMAVSADPYSDIGRTAAEKLKDF